MVPLVGMALRGLKLYHRGPYYQETEMLVRSGYLELGGQQGEVLRVRKGLMGALAGSWSSLALHRSPSGCPQRCVACTGMQGGDAGY